MRRFTVAILTCWSMVAIADSAAPLPHAQGREAWIGQCAVRMERAREEAGKRDARFKKGSVEATGREAAEAGDPTAKVAFDQVEYTLVVGEMLLQATVSTRPGENALIGEKWGAVPVRTAMPLYVTRATHGLTGSLLAKGTSGEPVKTFDGAFRKAVDDCLAMRKSGNVGKGGGN